MKLKPGAWIVIGFTGLILVALIISLTAPDATMPKADMDIVRNSPMPLIVDSSGVQRSTLPVLAERMPDFRGITRWWNTEGERALTAGDLKGKVVFIDFWTYSCINCIRTQPFLRNIWETYKDDGLVIVGVHTPEFAFEKDPENVANAIERAGLEYPIALDPDYATWNAYNNRYWPAGYFFDREGRLRFTHFGEGQYAEQENVIRELLAEGTTLTDAPTGVDPTPDFSTIKTPETYFGYARMAAFANRDEFRRDADVPYSSKDVGPNEWSLSGPWRIESERSIALSGTSAMRFSVESNAFHLVMGSSDGQPKRVAVTLIGEEIRPGSDALITPDMYGADLHDDEELTAWVVEVTDRDLYRILRFPDAGRHVVELQALDPGVEFYAATFGE